MRISNDIDDHDIDNLPAKAWWRSYQGNKGSLFFMLGMVTFLVACLVLLSAAFMYFSANKKTTGAAGTDTAAILLRVGHFVDLPSGETPQVAPITDLASFRNQPFFSRARVGDVLVIYMQSHLAILYSPEENKIINMSKISVVIPRPAALP